MATAVNRNRGFRWDGNNTRLSIYVNGIEAKRFDVPGATVGVDEYFFGSAAANYISWDASANDLKFEDSCSIMFGTGATAGVGTAGDVEMRWDGTDFDILATANNTVFKFGNGTNSFDVWLYGSSTDNYVVWDASANDLIFQDSCSIMLGTGTDVEIRWDSTDLDILAAADDSVFKIGNGTNSFDLWLYGNTTAAAVTWDASANDLKLEDATSIMFGTGGGVGTGQAGDVEIRWDSTDLDILAAADDSVIKFGNGTASFDVWFYGNTTDDYVVHDASANNLDLRGAMDLRIANIGTLDFVAAAAGQSTFTITGLTSSDIVLISPREATQGVLVVDKVEADKVTIRNSTSETANVELNYYVLAKAS